MPYNSIADETHKGPAETGGMVASGSSSGSTGSYLSPETVVEAWERVSNRLAGLEDRLTMHGEQITRLTSELAAIRHEPGPYAELTGRLKALEASQDILKRMVDSIGTLTDLQTSPVLTVRHWRSPEGQWLYETVVQLKPATAEAMGNTLGWVDTMARQESARRSDLDRKEALESRGSTQSYG